LAKTIKKPGAVKNIKTSSLAKKLKKKKKTNEKN